MRSEWEPPVVSGGKRGMKLGTRPVVPPEVNTGGTHSCVSSQYTKKDKYHRVSPIDLFFLKKADIDTIFLIASNYAGIKIYTFHCPPYLTFFMHM